jgi:hypothetical protein
VDRGAQAASRKGKEFTSGERPGISVLYRDNDGAIFHRRARYRGATPRRHREGIPRIIPGRCGARTAPAFPDSTRGWPTFVGIFSASEARILSSASTNPPRSFQDPKINHHILVHYRRTEYTY